VRETLLFLVLGAVAGIVAYIAMFRSLPQRPWGIVGAVAVGILGGVVGGWLMQWLGLEVVNWVGSLVVALAGALLLLWLIVRVLPKQPA
jgi:uncharacterized membrane protein YeaQ/YmgE (transglycosylase-associated protein family)